MKNILCKTGEFIQRIIIKNILLFITVGFIKWLVPYYPPFSLLSLIFTKYAVPLSIGYTTGSSVDEKHGGISGIIGTSLIISAGDTRNILEVILISFLVSFTVKTFKEKILTKIVPGFEMFAINFFVPAVSILYYFIFLKTVPYINIFFKEGTDIFLKIGNEIWGVAVLTVIIEISKIFFINNFINHGFLAVMGYKELLLDGKSLFFLLETNPGPGLGVLTALYFLSKDKRKNMFSNMVIEFFGGIHEIYFPHVLKNLKLIGAVILGGLAGNIFFYYFNVSLSGVPSPGSVVLITLLSSGSRFILLTGILLSSMVSFGVSYLILACEKQRDKNKISEEIFLIKEKENVEAEIVVLCNGGMGSSHIGSTILKKTIDKYKIENVKTYSSFIGDDIKKHSFIITHNNLKSRVQKIYPENLVVGLEDYTDYNFYDEFVKKYFILEEPEKEKIEKKEKIQVNLNLKSMSEEESINFLGEEFNIDNSFQIDESFLVVSKRENISSDKIIINQYPYGLKESEIFLVIGICTEDDKIYNKVIEKIYEISQDKNLISELEISDDKEDFVKALELDKIFTGGEKNA